MFRLLFLSALEIAFASHGCHAKMDPAIAGAAAGLLERGGEQYVVVLPPAASSNSSSPARQEVQHIGASHQMLRLNLRNSIRFLERTASCSKRLSSAVEG